MPSTRLIKVSRIYVATAGVGGVKKGDLPAEVVTNAVLPAGSSGF